MQIEMSIKKNIVLLGHGAGIKFSIDALIQQPNLGYQVVAVVTHPFPDHKSDLQMIEQRKDLYGDCAYNVFQVENDYGIKLHEASNVNDPEVIAIISSYNPHYIISIGCRNIIKSIFLNTFPNKVLNIHTTPLPAYRGAANDSWMILNGLWKTKQFGCVHFIDTGIDTGAIIEKSEYYINDKSYPIDVFKTRMATFKDLLPKALKKLESDDFVPEKQLVNNSSCFPRLYTPTDGCIQWQVFNGSELERFIYAFSYPFQGAHTFLEGKKINIMTADFIPSEGFHAFATGILFGKNEKDQYKVALRDGYLLIKEIEIDGGQIAQNKVFRLGKRLV